MKKKRKKQNRSYSLEFKLSAVQRLLLGETVSEVCRQLEIRRSLLYYWRERYHRQATQRLSGVAVVAETEEKPSTAEIAVKRIAELERKIGQQTLEVDFLKRAFKRVKASRPVSSEPGGTASTERSGQ